MALKTTIPTFDGGGSGTIAVTDTITAGSKVGARMLWLIFPDLTSTVTVNVYVGSSTIGGWVLDADRPEIGPLPFDLNALALGADAAVTINYAYGK